MKSLFFPALAASVSLFASSCAPPSLTKSHFYEFPGPSISELGVKKLPASRVIMKPIPKSALGPGQSMAKWQNSLRSGGLVQLGAAQYTREGRMDFNDLKQTAASLGAKVVYYSENYAGQGRKTVAVPVAHTPGRTITSSSNTYGTVNTSSSSYGMVGSTPYYGNSYGSGDYSQTSNSSTYIPGSTTYAARQVGFSAYSVLAIFCVPESDLSQEGLNRLRAYRRESASY